MRLFLLLGLTSLALLGCGQKSALFKSPPPEDNQVQAEQKQQAQEEPKPAELKQEDPKQSAESHKE